MQIYKNVKSSQIENPGKIEVGIDTVYIRENITKITEENFQGWGYDEKQFSKDEYIKFIAEENYKNQSEQAQANAEMVELVFSLMGG